MAKEHPDVTANKVLNWLLVNDGYHDIHTITKGCLYNQEYKPIIHTRYRHVIDRLHSAGLLWRKGAKKGTYALGVQSWDKNYPFKNPDDKAANVGVDWSSDKPFADEDDDKTKQLLTTLTECCTDLAEKVEKLEKEVNAYKDLASATVKEVHVKHYDGKVVKFKNKVLPRVYEKVLGLARCRRNILLVGPAGSGKSWVGKSVADSLKLDFGSISCTAGMSEAHLLGRSVPDLTHGKNRFQGTPFLKCYENGGLFLLDEMDAADPNLLLAINTALANAYCNVPNRPDDPVAVRHPDFVIVGTANTFGRGANRMYAGRNQLDEATIDRFRIGIVECDYDPAVEMALCPNAELREWCQTVRERINAAAGMRRIMSSRFMADAYVMVKEGNWSMDDVRETFFSGWTPEEVAKVTSA